MSTNHHPPRAVPDIKSLYDDFDQRVVVATETLEWLPTESPGVTIRPLEIVLQEPLRLTMVVSFKPGASYRLRDHFGSEELLVLDGTLAVGEQHYGVGRYIRHPHCNNRVYHSREGCTLFVKLGEFAQGDDAVRVIDTDSSEDWLPGPVDGTEVLALHMHDTRSILMIRWLHDATFKPGLDPQGEEIFVVRGQLFDADATYAQHCWIRNPVPAWQEWSGTAGTLVYYKNGHFPMSATSPVTPADNAND